MTAAWFKAIAENKRRNEQYKKYRPQPWMSSQRRLPDQPLNFDKRPKSSQQGDGGPNELA